MTMHRGTMPGYRFACYRFDDRRTLILYTSPPMSVSLPGSSGSVCGCFCGCFFPVAGFGRGCSSAGMSGSLMSGRTTESILALSISHFQSRWLWMPCQNSSVVIGGSGAVGHVDAIFTGWQPIRFTASCRYFWQKNQRSGTTQQWHRITAGGAIDQELPIRQPAVRSHLVHHFADPVGWLRLQVGRLDRVGFFSGRWSRCGTSWTIGAKVTRVPANAANRKQICILLGSCEPITQIACTPRTVGRNARILNADARCSCLEIMDARPRPSANSRLPLFAIQSSQRELARFLANGSRNKS